MDIWLHNCDMFTPLNCYSTKLDILLALTVLSIININISIINYFISLRIYKDLRKVNLISQMPFFHFYSCVCLYVNYVCACMWQPGDNLGCHPQDLHLPPLR